MANIQKQHDLARWIMKRNPEILALAVKCGDATVTFDRLGGEIVQGSQTPSGHLASELGVALPGSSMDEFGTGSILLDAKRCAVGWRPDVTLALVINVGSAVSKSLQRISRRAIDRFFGKRPERPQVAPVPAALREEPFQPKPSFGG